MFSFIAGEIYWHRIHSVYDEGPVGKVGIMKPGDFLVEVFNFLCFLIFNLLESMQRMEGRGPVTSDVLVEVVNFMSSLLLILMSHN